MNLVNFDLSVIVCCYNSVKRLHPTLLHLANQKVPDKVSWEVIVVDNNSADNTGEYAENEWGKLDSKVPFKLVSEPKPGLSYARKCGVNHANCKYIVFVDDDNSLANNYLETIYNLFENNSNIGIIGSYCMMNTNIPTISLPLWWKNFAHAYAINYEKENSKVVNSVCGAGMGIRRSSYNDLYKNGFESLLTDRKGNSLSSGGDLELCFAMRLIGFQIYYTRETYLEHCIDIDRVNREYLERLYNATGKNEGILRAYRMILKIGKWNWFFELVWSFMLALIRKLLVIFTVFDKNKKFIFQIKLYSEYNAFQKSFGASRTEYNRMCRAVKSLKAKASAPHAPSTTPKHKE